jgi:hypothetical protein
MQEFAEHSENPFFTTDITNQTGRDLPINLLHRDSPPLAKARAASD